MQLGGIWTEVITKIRLTHFDTHAICVQEEHL